MQPPFAPGPPPPAPPEQAYIAHVAYRPTGTPGLPKDSRATLSLVLGILSVTTMLCWLGFLAGLPALILGILARRAIARSNGALGGGGAALAGIVCGSIGCVVNVGQLVMLAVMFLPLSTPAPSPPPPSPVGYVPKVVASTPSALPSSSALPAPPPPSTPSTSELSVKALDPARGTLHDLLAVELATATAAGEPLVAYTTASWCSECREVETALADPAVASILAHADVVRVDVDDFKGQLAVVGMDEAVVPYFFLFDASSAKSEKPKRTLSADAWGDNTPANIAPPLRRLLSSAPPKPPPAAPAPSTRGTAL